MGVSIIDKLKQYQLTSNWLILKLSERNISTDASELSHTIHGRRKGNKAELIISTCTEILDEYEKNNGYS